MADVDHVTSPMPPPPPPPQLVSQATHPSRAKKNAEGSGGCAYNVHSPSIDGEAYFVCTAYETIVNMRLNLRLINSA